MKLEEALGLATDFHDNLQDFINWLTQSEQTLTMASPASLILETIMFQIDEHKVCVRVHLCGGGLATSVWQMCVILVQGVRGCVDICSANVCHFQPLWFLI